jgi:hypothetical protein
MLKEGEKVCFGFQKPAAQLGELPCAKGAGREDGAKDDLA